MKMVHLLRKDRSYMSRLKKFKLEGNKQWRSFTFLFLFTIVTSLFVIASISAPTIAYMSATNTVSTSIQTAPAKVNEQKDEETSQQELESGVQQVEEDTHDEEQVNREEKQASEEVEVQQAEDDEINDEALQQPTGGEED